VITRAAVTNGGIVVCNSADTVASTYDILTWVTCGGLLADIVLYRISWVADADMAISTKRTTPTNTTVDFCAWIGSGNTIITFAMVAFITDT
jgi:hypothetical protein